MSRRNRTPEYLEAVIRQAAHRLRGLDGLSPEVCLVATDLEDALRWTTNDKTCAHPYWDCREDGSTVCRTCATDTTGMEEMGT